MLADANELVETLKRAAIGAMEAKKPVNLCFGKVVATTPLKINVEQKMELSEKQLILSRGVTDYSVTVTADWLTESSLGTHSHTVTGTCGGNDIELTSDVENLAHIHKMTGKKKIIVHNGLAAGEEVILLRQQEGQKYIVLDRIGGRR